MTDRPNPGHVDETPADEELYPWMRDPHAERWMSEHMAELRRTVTDRRIRTQALVVGFVVGLASHVAGYLLRSAETAEPFGLLADLLYALGLALWTGVVLVLMVEVIPRAKERQIQRALDAYEAAARDKRAPGERDSEKA
jgi:hypothetical protein